MGLFLKRVLKGVIIASRYSPFALIWMSGAFLFAWPARVLSFARMPDAGADLGLKHHASDYLKEFGTLDGRVRGYRVSVHPDEAMASRISVGLGESWKKLNISLSKPSLRLKGKSVEIVSENRYFNSAFRTRSAHESVARNISENKAFTNAVMKFYSRWIFRIDGMWFDQEDLQCTFTYGFYLFPRLPARKLCALVNGLVDIAVSLESTQSI